MGLPGILPGGPGQTLNPEVSAYDAVSARQLGVPSGVFAKFPGATPKYAINKGPRDAEYLNTMARMFIQMSGKERSQFIKSVPPETRELARVLAGTGTRSGGGLGFIDFLLTQVDESFQEKFQIVETLSDNFIVYTFGQKAPMFTYSGIALNTYQDDQRVWLMRLYRDVLRGTQLARRKKLVRIRYDSVIVSGIFVAHSQSLKGDAENYAQFSFSLIPTQYVIFTPSVGVPAQATTAFTEGAALGLVSTQTPDDTRQRVAPTTFGTPSSKPAAQKTPSSLSTTDKRIVDKAKAAKVLADRAGRTTKVTKQPPKDTYGAPPVFTKTTGEGQSVLK